MPQDKVKEHQHVLYWYEDGFDGYDQKCGECGEPTHKPCRWGEQCSVYQQKMDEWRTEYMEMS